MRNAGRGRRRRRHHRDRHADGAVAVGAVRRRGRRARRSRCGASCSRTRTSTTSAAPRRSRTRRCYGIAADERRCSTSAMPIDGVQGVHARVRRGVRRPRRARHAAGHPPRRRRRAAHAARRGAARDRPHRGRPASCSSPTPTCCFAGDLCFFGVTPLAFQGDPAVWADVLDAVAELADVIVPGHGPVGGDAEVRELAGLPAALRRGLDPARPVGRVARARPRDAINIERARCSPTGATSCRRC